MTKRTFSDILHHVQDRGYRYLGAALFSALILSSLIQPTLNLPEQKPEGKPDFSFEDVKIHFFEGEELKWELNAHYADIYQDTETATLTAAKGRFYKEDQPQVIFYSPSARINTDQSGMTLYDADAVITSEDGPVSVKSKSLTWREDKNTFEGLGLTKVRKDNMYLEGEYFFVSIPIKKMIMAKNGKAIISKDDV